MMKRNNQLTLSQLC